MPILIKVQQLQRRLIDQHDDFGTAWNWVDAYLRLVEPPPHLIVGVGPVALVDENGGLCGALRLRGATDLLQGRAEYCFCGRREVGHGRGAADAVAPLTHAPDRRVDLRIELASITDHDDSEAVVRERRRESGYRQRLAGARGVLDEAALVFCLLDGADGVEATASARARATRRESASAPRRVPAGPSARADRLPREKSPLGSRSRASGTRPVAAPPSKRDRHGREVRPSIATSNLATRALANRDFSNRGEYRPEVSYGAYPNHGTGPSPGMYANEAYACVGEETRAFGSAEVSISARAAYGDRAAYDALRRERESAELSLIHI